MSETIEQDEIKVSVIVITYNHEKYIRKALDSILMQKVNFKYEILVGDDASIDSTPEIIREYKEKYPEHFNISLREKNLGGTRNSYELMMMAKGDYIANLEGDDYWIDENKLQKQVDYLEKNREYSACVCNFRFINDEGKAYPESEAGILRHNLYCSKEIYTLTDFNDSKLPSHSGTLMYRNIFKQGINGEIIYKAHRMIGDCTIIMLLLTIGNIYLMSDVMSCYRYVRNSSSWTSAEYNNPFLAYNTFQYYNYLEKYAHKYLRMKVDLKNYKARYFFSMVMTNWDHKSPSRSRCLKRMLRDTSHKLFYLRIIWDSLYLRNITGVVMQGLLDESYRNEKITWDEFDELAEGKKVVLFGAGGGCRDYLEKYYFSRSIEYVIDNSKDFIGKYVYGFKIFSPDKLKGLDTEKTVILITTGDNYIEQLKKQCKDLGLHNVYSFCHIECNNPTYDKYRKKYANKIYIKNV